MFVPICSDLHNHDNKGHQLNPTTAIQVQIERSDSGTMCLCHKWLVNPHADLVVFTSSNIMQVGLLDSKNVRSNLCKGLYAPLPRNPSIGHVPH